MFELTEAMRSRISFKFAILLYFLQAVTIHIHLLEIQAPVIRIYFSVRLVYQYISRLFLVQAVFFHRVHVPIVYFDLQGNDLAGIVGVRFFIRHPVVLGTDQIDIIIRYRS